MDYEHLNKNYSDGKVLKDMSQDYNLAIARLQNEIDEIKKSILTHPQFIINLKERIHALAVKLSPKMNHEALRIQAELNKKAEKINLFYYKKVEEDGEVVKYKRILPKSYYLLKRILEEREIHLNTILEQKGLTASQKETKRVV